MRRIVAVIVAVAALLAPATVAQAAAPYDLSISSDISSVYPYVDGFQDTAHIEVDVDAGIDPDAGGTQLRIRGSVVVTIGGRVAKTVMLSTTGGSHFDWNGRNAAGALVAGTATVTLRVDGYAPVSTTLQVSPKKVVPVTMVMTQIASDGIWCFDAALPPDGPGQLDTEVLCPNSYGSPIPDYVYMTMYGTKTTGGLMYIGRFWDRFDQLGHSALPVKVAVTAKFTQTGTGTSRFWVRPCVDYCDFSSGPNPITTFTKSGTYTATGVSYVDFATTFQPEWVVSVPKTVTFRITTFTIKVTYYKLR